MVHKDTWLQKNGLRPKNLSRLISVSSACAAPLPVGPGFTVSQALGAEKGRLLNCSVYPAKEHLTMLLKLFTSLWWKIILLLKMNLMKNMRIYAVKSQFLYSSQNVLLGM